MPTLAHSCRLLPTLDHSCRLFPTLADSCRLLPTLLFRNVARNRAQVDAMRVHFGVLARTPSADGIKGCSVRAQVLADFRYLQATVSFGFATENAFMSLNVPSKMRARDIFSIQRSRFWHSFLFKTRWFVHGFARRPWCGCTQGMHF